MDLTVQELGENSLIKACEASQLIEQGNISEAKSAMGVAKHIHEIAKLIERYTAVQDFYKQEEDSLTLKIGDILSRERDAQTQKSSAESNLRLQRNELSRHERDLESARGRLNSAGRKHRRRKRSTAITGVVAGVCTVLSFGAAAPVTAPLAVGAAAGALAFNSAADKAKDDMRRAEYEIGDTKRKINEYETAISSLNSTISQLNRDESCYREDRSRLEKEKGRIKEVIAFLIDAETYGNQYSEAAQACSQRTTLVEKVVSKAEKKGYSLFDSNGTERVLMSFEEAWETFQEMNKKGQGYVFKIDFQCCQCNCSCNEFPYVSSGKLICADCFELFQ